MNAPDARIEALINQGISAQQAERYAEAERAYRSALQLDPTHPRALALLGMLAGFAGFRAARRAQMVNQYRWINVPAGPMRWRRRTP